MAREIKIGATVRFHHFTSLGTVEQFAQFYSATFSLKPIESRCLTGCKVHFKKAAVLLNVANRMLPNLELDELQLSQRGYTPAENAAEICAIIESAILELYASLDCARSVFVAIFRGSRDMPTGSTRKLFLKCQDGLKYGDPFPESLQNLVKEAAWFRELMDLRDTLTHMDTGVISRDKNSQKISYFLLHSAHKSSLKYDDIFSWINEKVEQVYKFLDAAFSILLKSLSDGRVMVMCGFVDGRVLIRNVSFREEMSRTGGECGSAEWFELPENPTCPYSASCPVYAERRK